MRILTWTFLTLIIFNYSCVSQIEQSNIPEIEQYVLSMMDVHEVPGLAVCVFKNNRIVHRGYYGQESLDSGGPIDEHSVFKLFSLTKTFVATAIFQLIEEGKLSLEDPLSMYFDNLPENWQNVTIANLLSHSSGLPDVRRFPKELEDDSISDREFIKMLYNEPMEFLTNEQWNYNQTNYIFLKMIIEELSSLNFEEFVLSGQFSGSNSNSVYFSADPKRIKPNQVNYHEFDKEAQKFKRKKEFKGNRNLPLAGLSLTLNEYALWNERLDNDLLISNKSKQLMWTPFEFTNSNRAFLHGWDVYNVANYDSYGFSGGGVSGFRKYVDKDIAIMVLTSGYKYYSIHDVLIDRIASIIDESLSDEYAILSEDVMRDHFIGSSLKDISLIVQNVKTANPGMNLEEVFKSIGFTLFFQLDRQEEAIDLFKINVFEYPDSYDTYGSLGYLFFLSQRYEEARVNYVKALELNPNNNYSDRRIKEIDKILNSKNQ